MGDRTDSGMFDLSGKNAVVTGGAGIIGSSVCHGLAAQGANVAIVDIDVAAARGLADDLTEDHGVKALAVDCDVSSPEAVTQMVETVSAAFDGIHILHNNAATKTSDLSAFFAPVEDYTIETWREVMAVNLDGMFLVAQAVGRKMIEQGTGGSIIQTASIYGISAPDRALYEGSEYLGRPINTPAPYAVSKAGIVGLTRYLAACWADKGIRVNTLVPGGVESGQNETFKEKYASRVPMGRMADRGDMVGAVVYLASDSSSYMTGQMVVVDGGWTMR